MTGVVIPDHIANEIEKENKKNEPGWDANGSPVDDAFVKPEERVLDPSLLDKSLLERMPEPTGWRMLILPYRGKAVTKGGIMLAKETIDRESLATVVAYVLKCVLFAIQIKINLATPLYQRKTMGINWQICWC